MMDIPCPGGHNVSMGVTEVKAWVCDECGYLWIKIAGRNPLRCPSCRTRSWNRGTKTQPEQKLIPKPSTDDSVLVPFEDL